VAGSRRIEPEARPLLVEGDAHSSAWPKVGRNPTLVPLAGEPCIRTDPPLPPVAR
jgi:hypothetical protein